MSATLIFLHLARYVALLLWGIPHGAFRHRARLRGQLAASPCGIGLKNRWKAFLAGVAGITALLQSGAGYCIDVDELGPGRFDCLVPALAVTLGAIWGRHSIVQILTCQHHRSGAPSLYWPA